MDLVVEHLLVEVHRCLSSFFPTRFSGWPTSCTAGMMPPYGAQGELRRITLPRTPINRGHQGSATGFGEYLHDDEHLVAHAGLLPLLLSAIPNDESLEA